MIRPPRTSATGDAGQAPNVESRVFAASVDETTDVVRRMLPREVASVTEPTEGYFCWIVPKSGYAVHWNLRTVGLADGQSEVVLEAQVVPNPWMLLGGLLFVFATFGIGLLLVISFASQGGRSAPSDRSRRSESCARSRRRCAAREGAIASLRARSCGWQAPRRPIAERLGTKNGPTTRRTSRGRAVRFRDGRCVTSSGPGADKRAIADRRRRGGAPVGARSRRGSARRQLRARRGRGCSRRGVRRSGRCARSRRRSRAERRPRDRRGRA